ncbi:hypothetical protein TL16_g05977 [Triparma laevis f. inornata]|uniref:Uncharacterized protein n=1 Tax=Triparma laevis f. inornata TaxID=1714386 RepID=A0A9W7ARL4_9STRA|nr:hypothetical protein TL16_g05977 [Triparma laevis f. inornata]
MKQRIIPSSPQSSAPKTSLPTGFGTLVSTPSSSSVCPSLCDTDNDSESNSGCASNMSRSSYSSSNTAMSNSITSSKFHVSSFDLAQYQSCIDFDPTSASNINNSSRRQRAFSTPNPPTQPSNDDEYGHFIDILPPPPRPPLLPTTIPVNEPAVKSLLPPSIRDLFWTPFDSGTGNPTTSSNPQPRPRNTRLGANKRVEVKFRQPTQGFKPNTTRGCSKRSIINPSTSINININNNSNNNSSPRSSLSSSGRMSPPAQPTLRISESVNSSRGHDSPRDSSTQSSTSTSPVNSPPTMTKHGRFEVRDEYDNYSLTIETISSSPPTNLPNWGIFSE